MPVTPFDHLVYAVPNLQAANDALTAALGLRPVYGGEHAADYGTCNALLSLGPQCYLEVLAPVAAAGAALPPFAKGVAALPEGDVISFGVATSDLPAVQARALAAGLAVRPSKANSRVAPQGHTLRWQGLYLDHDLYRGLVPFYIDWMDYGAGGRGGAGHRRRASAARGPAHDLRRAGHRHRRACRQPAGPRRHAGERHAALHAGGVGAGSRALNGARRRGARPGRSVSDAQPLRLRRPSSP